MPNYTDNLSLKKWDLDDEDDLGSEFDIESSLNDNWDKVDEAIGTNNSNITSNTTDITELKESIATNTANIATNTANIEELQETVSNMSSTGIIPVDPENTTDINIWIET